MKFYVEDKATLENENIFKANSLKKIVEFLIDHKNEDLLPHNGYMNGYPWKCGETFDSLYEKNRILFK